MKKLIYCIVILCYFTMQVAGQKMLSSKEMVAISPAVANCINLPEYAKKALNQKLVQIVTQNGFGSASGDLVLTANVITTDKQVTGTVPPQYIISLEVSLYLLSIQEGVVLAEMSIPLKGIDKAEDRATAQAMNGLNPRTPAIRTFMEGCRGKVIDYYTTRIPALLAKAKSLADRGNYEEAISVLSAVPESVDEYPAVAQQMVAIFIKQVDREAKTIIQEAKAKMTAKDYPAALNALVMVDPSSTLFPEATRMISSIQQTINAEQKAAMEAQLAKFEAEQETRQRYHDDQVMLEKARIEAAQKAGSNYKKTSTANDAINTLVAAWFLGKFK